MPGTLCSTTTTTTRLDATSNCTTNTTMLSSARSRAVWQISRRAQLSARRSYAFSANDQQEINDPKKPKEVANVSKTNELPTEPGHLDGRLQENVTEGEKKRVMQAPNRSDIWSQSQNPRANAMTGPRFEQTIMEYQVCCLD
jgi:NADH dehydrogenase (ubiquinone) Fe-S protein 6